MELHGNARLTPHGQTLMGQRVRDEGWTVAEAAEAAGCSERTCYRWLVRYDAGEALTDRSSAPHEVPGRTPPETETLIAQLRHLRWTSTRIAAELDPGAPGQGAIAVDGWCPPPGRVVLRPSSPPF